MKPSRKRSRSFAIFPSISDQSGGPLTFSSHLKAYLERQGYQDSGTLHPDLGALIVFVRAPLRLLWKAKRLGVPVVLRLDGLYYPGKHGLLNREYLRVNFRVWFIRRYLCDFIIYQSDFCKAMADRLLGATGKPHRTIHNGTPAGPVLPPPTRASGDPLRLVATGRFRGGDMLPATVAALDLCVGKLDFTLDVFGHVDEPSRPFLSRPYLKFHGPVSNAKAREALPGYDGLIFTQLCAPCPNTVVEAVAAGVPVMAYDTGAVKELLTFNQELIAGTPDRLLHGMEDFDPRLLAECVLRLAADREGFRRAAEAHRQDFAEEKTLALYREVVEGFGAREVT